MFSLIFWWWQQKHRAVKFETRHTTHMLSTWKTNEFNGTPKEIWPNVCKRTVYIHLDIPLYEISFSEKIIDMKTDQIEKWNSRVEDIANWYSNAGTTLVCKRN